MADEKKEGMEHDEEKMKAGERKQDEISEKDLGGVSGGYTPEKDDGTL